jgi:hypothetical protein
LKWSRGLEHEVSLLWKRFTKTVTVLWSLSVNFEESSGFIAIVLFHQPMPSAHAIKTWVRNFEATGSTLSKKGDSVTTVRTPENIVVVREAIEGSPHGSAHRNSVSLGLSGASFRRILHQDLHFYRCKVQVTLSVHDRD